MTRSQGMLTLAAIGALTLTSTAWPRHFPLCIYGPYRGITQTTGDGTIIGDPDPRDWGCVGDRGPGPRRPAPDRAGVALPDPGAGAGPPTPPPTVLCMDPAAPNPAEQATRIQFALPASGQVNVSVYGPRRRHEARETSIEEEMRGGRAPVVRILVDATLAAGTHAIYWDLSDDMANRLPPGIYRVVLVVGDDALCGDVEVR